MCTKHAPDKTFHSKDLTNTGFYAISTVSFQNLKPAVHTTYQSANDERFFSLQYHTIQRTMNDLLGLGLGT